MCAVTIFCMPRTPILVKIFVQIAIVSNTQMHCFIGLIASDENEYRKNEDHFVSWCKASCLELNVIKTKEMVINFLSGVHHPNSVNIKGQIIYDHISYMIIQ